MHALRRVVFDGQHQRHEARAETLVEQPVVEARLVEADAPMVNKTVEVPELTIAGSNPQHLHFSTRVSVGHQPLVERTTERAAEARPAAAFGEAAVVQHDHPVEEFEGCRYIGRHGQLQRANRGVGPQAAPNVGTAAGAQQADEVPITLAHSGQVNEPTVTRLAALESGRRLPGRQFRSRCICIAHVHLAPARTFGEHPFDHRMVNGGRTMGVEQEAVVFDRQRIEGRQARLVEVSGSAHREQAATDRRVEDHRQADQTALLARAEHPALLDMLTQARQPVADPGPGEKKRGPSPRLQLSPLGRQLSQRGNPVQADGDRGFGGMHRR